MVRMSLVDDEANVRAAAAKAFDVLQEQMGAKAIDETIPTLLEALRQPGKGSGTALQALREVMNVCCLHCLLLQSHDTIPGPRRHGLPRSHPDTHRHTDDGLQCARPCGSCHGRRKRSEQTSDRHHPSSRPRA